MTALVEAVEVPLACLGVVGTFNDMSKCSGILVDESIFTDGVLYYNIGHVLRCQS